MGCLLLLATLLCANLYVLLVQNFCLDDARAQKLNIFGQVELDLSVGGFSFRLERRTGTRDGVNSPSAQFKASATSSAD
ncbi:hypothetical protein NA56DRAFT_641495 [Hyaloscypha hepaticicola]|uniref:Uncharacterized protein n=1 Tax=Hyaloscypha hepaticicola TaxID=2082293 RepID=A0A2J6QKT5_9HELO|nr:hypothetical protein NA56DRAFT_641495 [Hyaloscypha hepaticicola]